MKMTRRRAFALIPAATPLFAGQDSFEPQPFVAAFDQVWNTIREKYWDPKLTGLNWEECKAELRPRVEAAKSAGEARSILVDLLSRMKQSHFGLIPPQAYAAMDPAQGPRGDSSPGIDIRILKEGAVVTRVQPGSSAESAGVRPGWLYLPNADLSGLSPMRRHFATVVRLQGPAGSRREFRFEDNAGVSRTVTLELTPPPGKLTRFGNLPPLPLSIAHRKLGESSVLTVSAFFDPEWLQKECAALVESAKGSRGVIIDVRGNPGGISGLAAALAGWFVKDPSVLGTLTLRGATLKLYVNPRPEPYLGPVAILVDPLSMSTAEFFAGGLKDIGRATLFGETTGGAALPSVIEKLPTGDGFQYAIARYESASGKELEGAGVSPHVHAPPERAALAAGHDNAMEQALEWIRKEK